MQLDMLFPFEFGIIYLHLAIKLYRNVLTGNQNYDSPDYVLPEQLKAVFLEEVTDILIPCYINGDVTLDGMCEKDGNSQKNLHCIS